MHEPSRLQSFNPSHAVGSDAAPRQAAASTAAAAHAPAIGSVGPVGNTAPVPRRWRPVPFIAISIALHVACLLACVLWPAQWPWWLAAVLGNQALIVALVFLPRAQALGRTVTRLPAPAAMQGWVALTFDDGPDPAVTPQVLELLDRYQAKASFFCIGVAVQRHPDLVREIIARGHSVENHSHSHSPLFAFWGCGRMRQDIERLQQAVQGITGTWPRFFRPTAGFRNPLLDGVLARTGLHLVMWTRRGFDTRCRSAHTVRERLLRGLRAGDILLLHDGNAARTEQGEPLVLAVLPAVLQALQDQGLQAVTLRQGLAGLLDDAGPTPESAAPQSATSCPSLPTNNITP